MTEKTSHALESAHAEVVRRKLAVRLAQRAVAVARGPYDKAIQLRHQAYEGEKHAYRTYKASLEAHIGAVAGVDPRNDD